MIVLKFFERKSFVCVALVACFAARPSQAGAEDVVTQPVRTFVGHIAGYTRSITSVAFSSDGTRLLTGSWDRTAKLWDVATGSCIRTFIGHISSVMSVAFSPDGTRILTGSLDGMGGIAKLWDVATGVCIRTYSEHTDMVSSVAFSPDGACVLTGSDDGTAKLWDVATGSCIRTFAGHAGGIWSVAFSPDGTHVLTGGNDWEAKIWDVATGSCIRTFIGHASYVSSVAFSPDRPQVLTGSYDDTAKIWDVATGSCIRTFIGHTASIHSVTFSPDGTKVLTGSSDPIVKLWDAETGECIRTFQGGRWINSVAFSPNGTCFVAGGGDSTAKLWRTDASSPRPTVSWVAPAIPVATGTSQPFAICGANFDQNANVTLRCISSGEVFPNQTISSRSDTRITINPNFGTTAGEWSVEVINPGPVSSGEFNFSVKQAGVSIGSVDGDLQLRLPFPDGAEYQVTQGYIGISHTGYQVDFGTGFGKPVVAVAKGVVFEVGDYSGNCYPTGDCPEPKTKTQSGIYVKLKHQGRTLSWYSSYLHFSRRVVNQNDSVEQGQIIGYTGNTGYSDGAHLHFHMRNAADVGVRPVPMNGIAVSTGATTITDFVKDEHYRAISSSVQNGSFADGLLNYWTSGSGDFEVIRDPTWPDRCWVRFIAHSTATLSQTVSTPLDRFEVSFDCQFNTTSGSLAVVLDSVVLGTIEAPTALSGNFTTSKFTVTDPSLRNLQNVVLEFQFSGPAGSEILAGNIMLSPVQLSGDANDDCKVDILDLIFIRNRLNQDPSTGNNWNADLNQDGKINILDLIFVRNKLGTKCSQ